MITQPIRPIMVKRGAVSRLISLYGHLAPSGLSVYEIGEAMKSAGLIEWVLLSKYGRPEKWRETAEFGALDPAEKLALVKAALDGGVVTKWEKP